MNLPEATEGCRQGIELDGKFVPGLVQALFDPKGSEEEKKTFLLALTQKGETAGELAGFAAALLPLAKNPGFHKTWNDRPILDCCGTGGGGLNMINFSTALMFVLAGAGVPVVKHGNRGLTKTSGSADALEALGVRIDLNPSELQRCLEKTGMAFIFAPAYHGSFRIIAPVRKAIAAEGSRTIFNLLGPLLNPARPASQLTGVFRQEHLSLFAEALARLGRSGYRVVYGESPEKKALGEASPSGLTKWKDKATLETQSMESNFAASREDWNSLLVNSAWESAERIVALLNNQGTPLARELLLLNSAHALCAHGSAANLEEGMAMANRSLESGEARNRLNLWRSLQSAPG